MKVTGPLGKVIGITDDWKIVEQKVANNGTTTYYIRFIGRTVCPECGRPCPKKDSVEVSWSAGDMCGFPVIISGKVPRARCPEHGIRTIDVAFASNIARVTGSLERKVAFESMRSTFTSVASKYHLNTNTVIRIATHWARKLEDGLDLSHTTSFLIDEKSYKSGHRYITFIVDPGSGATLFGTEGRSCDTLEEFFGFMLMHGGDPFKVRFVCADMSPAFAKGIREWFPNATLIIDPYHLFDLISRNIDKIRRRIGLKSSLGKGARTLLQTNHVNLEPGRKGELIELVTGYKELGELYILKELLRDLYVWMRPTDAELMFGIIISFCDDSGYRSVRSMGRVLRKHKEGILAWHLCPLNNGPIEGRNSVTQSMINAARGYRNPANLISLVYLRSMWKHPSLCRYNPYSTII